MRTTTHGLGPAPGSRKVPSTVMVCSGAGSGMSSAAPALSVMCASVPLSRLVAGPGDRRSGRCTARHPLPVIVATVPPLLESRHSPCGLVIVDLGGLGRTSSAAEEVADGQANAQDCAERMRGLLRNGGRIA